MKSSKEEKEFMRPIYWLVAAMFAVCLACGADLAKAQSTVVNTQKVLLTSAARTATTSTADQVNSGWTGAHIILDITGAGGGGETLTLAINARNPATGTIYPLLTGLAITSTGTNVYKISPGIGAIANGAAQDILPQVWQVTVTHSASASWTYSVSAFLEQ